MCLDVFPANAFIFYPLKAQLFSSFKELRKWEHCVKEVLRRCSLLLSTSLLPKCLNSVSITYFKILICKIILYWKYFTTTQLEQSLRVFNLMIIYLCLSNQNDVGGIFISHKVIEKYFLLLLLMKFQKQEYY